MATLRKNFQLLRGLIHNEVAHAGPLYVDVDLTGRCNLRCFGCPYHSPYVDETSLRNPAEADIPVDLFERLCKELKSMDTHTLILQGSGEPLLHPDATNMISAARTAGLSTVLISNGTLLDRQTIRELMDAGLHSLKVSLWASSPEQYEQSYPGTSADTFRQVVDALKLVSRLKAERNSVLPTVCLHHPINRQNYQTIDAFVDLALATGCDELSFAAFCTVRGELSSFALSPVEEQSVRVSLLHARRRLHSLPIKHNIDEALARYAAGRTLWKKLPCYIAWFHARIRVDGTVQPCGRCNRDLHFGNLHENTFHDIWNGPAIRAFRREAARTGGLASIAERCDCDFCCYARDNMRVHRLFRWVAPLVWQPDSAYTESMPWSAI
ncbi:MAG: radical SAM protein [Anaerolineae bacterium]|nr:radical SAM protein [Anaerolineae bacterium]NIN96941.1 radical SAM protein [Anaerolineae bacterium]NIQ79902.1 radical SAM protein [Anaerolineae bacterium]